MEAEANPATVMYAACNSPIGRGLNCDTDCCGRAKRRTGCHVGLRDGGPAIPYPCLINSGVYFIKAGAAGRALLKTWEGHQKTQRESYGEQEGLNIVKEAHPDLIEVVGGQVMNTHSSFHSRMLSFWRPEVAYDIALRLSTGYEPSIPTPGFPQGKNVPLDTRLNVSLYQEAAMAVYGLRLGSSALLHSLDLAIGECVSDRSAFICHPFARPEDWKQKLVTKVATAKRAQLERLLADWRNGSYAPADRAAKLHLNTTRHHSRHAQTQQLPKPLREHSPPPPSPPPPAAIPSLLSASGRRKPQHQRVRREQRPANLSAAPKGGTLLHAGDQGLVLVCIAGQLRTFLQPEVQEAFATNVHRAGYEYVVSTDRAAPPAGQGHALRIAPLLEWVQHNGTLEGTTREEEDGGGHVRGGTQLEGTTPEEEDGGGHVRGGTQRQRSALPACGRRTCHPYRRPEFVSMAEKIASCHAPMQREEARRAFAYAFVLRLRPDHLFLRPLPPPSALLRAAPSGRILLWDDQLAVARRWLAVTVLLTPKVVFSACPSAAQWMLACTRLAAYEPSDARALNASIRLCHVRREQPCETMNLITAFSPARKKAAGGEADDGDTGRGTITHERLRLAHRTWREGQRLPVNSGDFCIKRDKWLLDDAHNDCRNNGGCMDC